MAQLQSLRLMLQGPAHWIMPWRTRESNGKSKKSIYRSENDPLCAGCARVVGGFDSGDRRRYLFDAPNVIRYSRFHCGRSSQRLMNPSDVIVHIKERDGSVLAALWTACS